EQIPDGDPFFCSWADFLAAAEKRGVTVLNLFDEVERGRFAGFEKSAPKALRALAEAGEDEPETLFTSLEAFRPQADRAADPEVTQVQRREFFNQLHRWLRQGYQVLVFCNNDGERQRFEEI